MADLSYFNETHGMVRDTVRKFVEREILPQVNDWEEAGTFPGSCTRRRPTPASSASAPRNAGAAAVRTCS